MTDHILVLYGSYRSDRAGIRLADYLVRKFDERGDTAELIDARSIGLPMLDRMYKEFPRGEEPPALKVWQRKFAPPMPLCSWPGSIIGASSPVSRTSLTTSSKNGSGVPPRWQATLQVDLPERAQTWPGMGPFPRWEWWSSQAPLQSGRFRAHSMKQGPLLATLARSSPAHFHALPMTSLGGLLPPNIIGLGLRHPTDCHRLQWIIVISPPIPNEHRLCGLDLSILAGRLGAKQTWRLAA